MDRQQAVTAAARAVIEHDGAQHRTDPRIGLHLMEQAVALGASYADIAAEILRQRPDPTPPGRPRPNV
ncbi:hypothetical protein AB0442_38980 [Kitasatospora sp. NPDC085895]|uniref:hypothetical protein n=1 Tax=Kitasatospora sp. NPDC085895 TaxID=3155057 RepID=UPI00344FC724